MVKIYHTVMDTDIDSFQLLSLKSYSERNDFEVVPYYMNEYTFNIEFMHQVYFLEIDFAQVDNSREFMVEYTKLFNAQGNILENIL